MNNIRKMKVQPKRLYLCMLVFLEMLLILAATVSAAEEEKLQEVIPLINDKNSGVDVVLVMDHSKSIRGHSDAIVARDTSARTLVSLCGGVGSTMGIVYFSGGFLPEDSSVYLPLEDDVKTTDQEDLEKEIRIKEAYTEYIEDSQASKLANLNILQEREALIEEQIGVLSESVTSLTTNIAVGLNRAVDMLQTGQNDEKVIILFSDGNNDTPGNNEDIEFVYNKETERIVEKARKIGIKIYVVYLEEYNEAQSDKEKLKEIVNYFGKEDNAEERFSSVGSNENLEQEFLSVLQEITDVKIVEKEINSSGKYTLGDLPETDLQSVSLVFRGNGVQIQNVKKDNEPEENCFYNYGEGTDCISGVYFAAIDSGSDYEIVTNGQEEYCYEIYNSSLSMLIKEAGEDVIFSLCRQNGEQISLDADMRMAIVGLDDRESTSKIIEPVFDENYFILESVRSELKENSSYQIILYEKDSESIGSCFWRTGKFPDEQSSFPPDLWRIILSFQVKNVLSAEDETQDEKILIDINIRLIFLVIVLFVFLSWIAIIVVRDYKINKDARLISESQKMFQEYKEKVTRHKTRKEELHRQTMGLEGKEDEYPHNHNLFIEVIGALKIHKDEFRSESLSEQLMDIEHVLNDMRRIAPTKKIIIKGRRIKKVQKQMGRLEEEIKSEEVWIEKLERDMQKLESAKQS